MSSPTDPLLWVAGGRDYDNGDAVKRELLPYYDWTLITGAAPGADLTSERAWRRMERPYIGIPARWAANGRAAGPMRNDVIAEAWRPQRLLWFPGGSGTADAIRRAAAAGIEVVEAET